MRKIISISALLASTSIAGAAPVFTPVSQNIEHQYLGGWEHFVGGGAAAFDCNNDQLPDIFLAGGSAPSTLLLNTTTGAGAPLAFEKLNSAAVEITGATGAYPININNDQHMDLMVLRVGENILLEGKGDCAFTKTEIFEKVPVSTRWTTAFSATWEASNTRPTLAFGNYVDRMAPDGPFGKCEPNLLLEPNENHQYTHQTLLEPGYCALSILFSDWRGGAGAPDLRISNDRHYYLHDGQEQLWDITGATPKLYAENQGWIKHQIWGMGIASRDIDFDGMPEVFLTSMGDQKLHSLKKDGQNPSFTDASFDRGITAHRPYLGDDGRPSTGWHAAFGDVQNDGLDDIFIAKGNVDQMMAAASKDPNNLLVQQADGNFIEQGDGAGIGNNARSRGAILADLNLDGRLDLIVNNRRANVEIYQNTTPNTGNWLAIKLNQSDINRDAIGAWIKIRTANRTYSREMTIGGGHAGGSLLAEHFGLGAHETAQIKVIWPDKTTTEWRDIKANNTYQILRDGPQMVVKIIALPANH